MAALFEYKAVNPSHGGVDEENCLFLHLQEGAKVAGRALGQQVPRQYCQALKDHRDQGVRRQSWFLALFQESHAEAQLLQMDTAGWGSLGGLGHSCICVPSNQEAVPRPCYKGEELVCGTGDSSRTDLCPRGCIPCSDRT